SEGVAENFPITPPVSLYGATKLASEVIALEYGEAFGLPIWINRCGVLAGAGQFGIPDQGIFAFWINSYLRRRPLKYIGFDGQGHQVRDCLHPRHVAALGWTHMKAFPVTKRALQSLSVVIPAQNEKECIESPIQHLYVELRLHNVPHEIVVVHDGSTDQTWTILTPAPDRVPTLKPVKNPAQRA